MPTGIGSGIAGQVFDDPLSRDLLCPAEYCYEFDGISEGGFGALGSYNVGNKNFTVSIWFKAPDVTGGGVEQSLYGTKYFGAATQTWEIYLTSAGKVAFKSNLTGWSDTFAAFTPVNNTWHNVMYSVDRSGNAVWYGDLLTTQSTNISANPTNLYSAGAYAALAGGFSVSDKYEGLIADIALWDIAFDATQVSEYYLNSKSAEKLCANASLTTFDHLQLWHRFTNPTGTYAAVMANDGRAGSGFGLSLIAMAQANVITDYPT